MQPFQLRPGEKLLVNDPHAVWMKGGTMTVEGQLKLTDQRLVFVKNASEIAGPLKLFMKSLRAHILLEFPIDKIKNFKRAAFGKNQRIVIDNGVDRPREFEVSKLDVMQSELKRIGVEMI